MLIHPLETLLNVHVTIKINIAIDRMIIMTVKVKILLISQIRDIRRISAGFIGIGIVRKEPVHHKTLQFSVRRGECSLHLIEHNTVIDDRFIRSI